MSSDRAGLPAITPVFAAEPIIEVVGLGKSYRLYHRPIDRLKQILLGDSKKYYTEQWAVRNLSFSIRRGQTVGIIGRNGAGKSTLLQMVTGTLTPTEGAVHVRGRVSALLELGSGINPEFNGYDNIRLLCAIMGLTEPEINDKVPGIVEFSELGDALNRPVKTYSSGMYVRLAFSIATCVDPDILIVDEALSVGDVAFRNKCMQRILSMRSQGATILFVSHDLSTLQLLCDSAIWLDNGRVRAIGDPVALTQDFHAFMVGDRKEVDMPTPSSRKEVAQQQTDIARFVEFRLGKGERPIFASGEDIEFKFAVKALKPLDDLVFGLSIYRNDGDWLIGQTSLEAGVRWGRIETGGYARGGFILINSVLGPGTYGCAIAAYSRDYSICYAMTELNAFFDVRCDFPTWGKLVHPCKWMVE